MSTSKWEERADDGWTRSRANKKNKNKKNTNQQGMRETSERERERERAFRVREQVPKLPRALARVCVRLGEIAN